VSRVFFLTEMLDVGDRCSKPAAQLLNRPKNCHVQLQLCNRILYSDIILGEGNISEELWSNNSLKHSKLN